jgi:omega-amidase
VKVALVSLDPTWEDVAANLDACRARIQRAAELGAELVVFPEMVLTGFSMGATSSAEHAGDSPSIRSMADAAVASGVCVAFGMVLHGTQRPRNAMVVLDEHGVQRAVYGKVHPFSLAGEHAHFEAGAELVVADLAGVAFGLAICYDLRFPELFAAMAADCDAFLVIASWPAPRIEHWFALLRARAIESQCYVVGVNRTGADGAGMDHPPSSCVFGPGGDAMEPVTTHGDIAVFDVDPAIVRAYRSKLRFLPDRVPAVYARPVTHAPPAAGPADAAHAVDTAGAADTS